MLTTYVKPSNFVTPDNADERKGTSLPFTEGRRCATWELGSSGVRMTLGPLRARMLACRVEWEVPILVREATLQLRLRKDIHTEGNIKLKENS